MQRALRLIVASCLIQGSGAFWVGLQLGAWAKMAVEGESKPCGVCLVVDAGMRTTPASTSVPNAHFAFDVPALEPAASLVVVPLVPPRPTLAGRAVPPLEPPPDRSAAA